MAHNLTPEQFADRIGGKKERQHVYAWEHGTVPTINSLVAIVNAFGISFEFFFDVTYSSENNDDANGNHIKSIAAW